MKKKLMPIFALLLALMMVLTSCDSIPGRSSGDDDDDDRRGSNSENDDRQDRDDDDDRGNSGTGGSLFGGLFGGNSGDSSSGQAQQEPGSSGTSDGSGSGDDDEGELYEGKIGDSMSTYWFKFTLEDARCYSSLNGHTPRSGYKYLVLDMTITNTWTRTVEMYDWDFFLFWGPNDGEDDYPVTEVIDDNQLPETYKIPIAGTKTGTLVFEVPTDVEDFVLEYLEVFDDGAEGRVGDTFWVYFTAGDILSDPNPSTGNDTSPDSGPITGYMGDTMSTAFFNFRVDDMAAYSSIGDHTPSAGNMYLALLITITNTQSSSLPMFDTDFWLVWGAEDGEDGFPITETVTEYQLPEEYYIPVNGTQQGYLIYEVPRDADFFILDYEEIYNGGVRGDDFWVYLALES